MKLAILGAGESGVGTAILAQQQGYEVFVSDMGTIKPKYKKKLNEHNIRWEEGQHTEAEILSADEVVKSPGIHDTAPMVQALIKKGTPPWRNWSLPSGTARARLSASPVPTERLQRPRSSTI